MTSLTIKNQELETNIGIRDLTPIVDGLIHGTIGIPDVDLREISVAPSFFYATNNLVITLSEESGPPAAVFANDSVRINGFWKYKNESSDGTEFQKYRKFNTPAEVILFSPTKMIIRIAQQDADDVLNYFESIGATKPDYGAMTIVVSLQNVGSSYSSEHIFLVKYTHNPLYSLFLPGLIETPLITGENTYKSPPYSSETLFIPVLSSSFVYNYFESEEDDETVYAARSYRGRKVSDIPKYVKLNWTKPVFDPVAFERENEMLYLLFPIGETSTPTEETGAVRVGGLIITTELAEEASEMMTSTRRTSEDAAELFDGIGNLREEGSSTAGAIIDDPGVLERAGGADQFDGNSFIDGAATDPPLGEVTINYGNITDYVGYVIEKSRYNEDGTFEPIDLIAISGKDSTEFIDWKIAYGEIYKYRIRSVFKFYNKYDLSMFSDSDSLLNKSQTAQYVDASAIWARKVFYFDSGFSDATECQTTELTRPNPPTNIRLFPNSREKKIFITWNQKAQNRDVVGFNVYRRLKNIKNSMFLRLNSGLIDIRNNYYVDFDIEEDVEYIYAIEAVDFHGNFSLLSAQCSTKIKTVSADIQICEALQIFEDVEGREIGEFKTNNGPNAIIFKRNFSIKVNPLFKNVNNDDVFVLRVTSLDTGMKKEIKLNFRTLTIYHSAGYVPQETEESSGFIGILAPELWNQFIFTLLPEE